MTSQYLSIDTVSKHLLPGTLVYAVRTHHWCSRCSHSCLNTWSPPAGRQVEIRCVGWWGVGTCRLWSTTTPSREGEKRKGEHIARWEEWM